MVDDKNVHIFGAAASFAPRYGAKPADTVVGYCWVFEKRSKMPTLKVGCIDATFMNDGCQRIV